MAAATDTSVRLSLLPWTTSSAYPEFSVRLPARSTGARRTGGSPVASDRDSPFGRVHHTDSAAQETKGWREGAGAPLDEGKGVLSAEQHDDTTSMVNTVQARRRLAAHCRPCQPEGDTRKHGVYSSTGAAHVQRNPAVLP